MEPTETFAFSGLTLAACIPFTATHAVDYPRFEALLERCLDAGFTRILLSSGTGMHVYLSARESAEVIAFGARVINGRAHIMAQASALRTQDVIARAQQAADCGAQGVLVLPPFFEGPVDADGVFAFYAQVATAGVPIIGYNVPAAAGVEMTPALLQRLRTIPEFIAIKDSSGDFIRQMALIDTGFPVLNGADPLMMHAMYAGCKGAIWGGANIAPQRCVTLFRAMQDGDWARARVLWQPLAPLMRLLWGDHYVASVYAAMALTGHDAGTPRPPLLPLSQEAIEPLATVITPLLASARSA